jgi:hypothetical protein
LESRFIYEIILDAIKIGQLAAGVKNPGPAYGLEGGPGFDLPPKEGPKVKGTR